LESLRQLREQVKDMTEIIIDQQATIHEICQLSQQVEDSEDSSYAITTSGNELNIELNYEIVSSQIQQIKQSSKDKMAKIEHLEKLIARKRQNQRAFEDEKDNLEAQTAKEFKEMCQLVREIDLESEELN